MNKEEVHHHLQCITCFSASPPPVHQLLQCINCFSASIASVHHHLQCIITFSASQPTMHHNLHCITSTSTGIGKFGLGKKVSVLVSAKFVSDKKSRSRYRSKFWSRHTGPQMGTHLGAVGLYIFSAGQVWKVTPLRQK